MVLMRKFTYPTRAFRPGLLAMRKYLSNSCAALAANGHLKGHNQLNSLSRACGLAARPTKSGWEKKPVFHILLGARQTATGCKP